MLSFKLELYIHSKAAISYPRLTKSRHYEMIFVSHKLFPFIYLLKVSANKESAYNEIPGEMNYFFGP